MYKRRIAVRGIIYKNGKLFAQKLKNRSGKNAFWSTPGGGLNDGEHLLAGLHRELVEETGIAPHIGPLVLIQQFHDGSQEQLEFFFHVKNAGDYEQIDLAKTSHGELEIAEFGFIDPQKELVLPNKLRSFNYEQLTGVNIVNYLPL
ncbi:MAG TPA: NUDIX domain-containing protein [Candidatus Saccharimonadales bacterium]|nr:NUDIX domain-containing protein [Candidatus Saccharimonadales bacterium]